MVNILLIAYLRYIVVARYFAVQAEDERYLWFSYCLGRFGFLGVCHRHKLNVNIAQPIAMKSNAGHHSSKPKMPPIPMHIRITPMICLVKGPPRIRKPGVRYLMGNSMANGKPIAIAK